MKYKNKIFSPLTRPVMPQAGQPGPGLFSRGDPFDFYRVKPDPDRYIPITQQKVRKSFSKNLVGIEFYMEMATSLRPLIDEAQDLDEITRLFSQHKLVRRPNVHSVKILRSMIKDPNPEIALYAAEGLNSIEHAFIKKIITLREKIEHKKDPGYSLYYRLGKLYLAFAHLLEGQGLIQEFYIDEAITALEKALTLKDDSYAILKKTGSAWLMKNNPDRAIKILSKLIGIKNNDTDLLLMLAECFYQIKEFNSLRHITHLLSNTTRKIDSTIKMVISQWI